MKIGIVTCGGDMMTLFNFLHRYDHEYIVYYDNISGFWGDKPVDFSLDSVSKGISYLRSQGCEKIIIPPLYELLIGEDDFIVPLFQEYILKVCLPGSLIGKIGFIGDYADITSIEKIFVTFSKKYQLTLNQQKIKKFHTSFPLWCKETPLRKYFLFQGQGKRHVIDMIVKQDLRYFNDAAVDTIIPLHYGCFAYQKTIRHFFNRNKTKFHGLDNIEHIFENIVKGPKKTQYSVKIAYKGQIQSLQSNKRTMMTVMRGKEVIIAYEQLNTG